MTIAETTTLILSLVAPQPCPCLSMMWACQACWKSEGSRDEDWAIEHDDDCENCQGTGTVEHVLAGPVQEALSIVCRGGFRWYVNQENIYILSGMMAVPEDRPELHHCRTVDLKSWRRKGWFEDCSGGCHGTGRVPIKVDLDSPRSVAEACGRLLLLNVIPVEQRNEHYGAMMVAVVLRDLEAALTALAAMLQAMKGESDG